MRQAWRWCSPAFDSSGTNPRPTHDRPTDPGRRSRAASLSARGPRGPGRARAVRADARAHHAILGRVRVPHRRTRTGDSPPSREPALRHSGACMGAAPVGRRLCPTHQSVRGRDERGVRGPMVPHRRALVAGHRGARTGTPAGRGRGCRRRRHDIHRVEPVGGEREGLYAERADDRVGALARGAVGGPAGEHPARSSPGPHRLPARPHGDQPPDGRPRGTGGARVRAAHGPARAAPSPVSGRGGARRRGRDERQPLHPDSGALRPVSEPG